MVESRKFHAGYFKFIIHMLSVRTGAYNTIYLPIYLHCFLLKHLQLFNEKCKINLWITSPC